MPDALPIMRPKLPGARSLLPYLSEIDTARVYSNFGPLATLLENRLAEHFGVVDNAITTVANATLGLTLGLAAQRVRPGTLCVMPAWTFVASPQAASLAGLVPYFVDVDPETWAIEADAIDAVIEKAPAAVGAVMPVVPFGRPIDVEAWDRFRARTGLAVVLDAAAGFDSVTPTGTPAVVSLHATKVLGSGEGGFVICGNADLILDIRARMNFGFHGSREARVAAFNAKLSEYHAAVGHASLDEWQEARAEWLTPAAHYRRLLADSSTARLQRGFGESWVSSVCVLHMRRSDADHLEQHLSRLAIETRHWWGNGAHAHFSMASCPRAALPVTEELSRSTLAIPIFRDLTAADIDRIIAGIETV